MQVQNISLNYTNKNQRTGSSSSTNLNQCVSLNRKDVSFGKNTNFFSPIGKFVKKLVAEFRIAGYREELEILRNLPDIVKDNARISKLEALIAKFEKEYNL